MTSHTQTINTDFGHRSYQETSLFEMATVVDGIKYLHRNLARWMRPERRRVALHFLPTSTRVAYQPLGVRVSLGIALLRGVLRARR
jgi:coniferyl-aldehyde dehydrogenase